MGLLIDARFSCSQKAKSCTSSLCRPFAVILKDKQRNEKGLFPTTVTTLLGIYEFQNERHFSSPEVGTLFVGANSTG